MSTMSGSWQVTKPGRAATFKASGVAAAGAETTVRTVWTSATHRSRELSFEFGDDYGTVVPGSPDNGITLRVEFRTRHRGWLTFGGGSGSYSTAPLDGGGQGVGALLVLAHPLTGQWRVIATATYDDTSRQSFSEAVKAL